MSPDELMEGDASEGNNHGHVADQHGAFPTMIHITRRILTQSLAHSPASMTLLATHPADDIAPPSQRCSLNQEQLAGGTQGPSHGCSLSQVRVPRERRDTESHNVAFTFYRQAFHHARPTYNWRRRPEAPQDACRPGGRRGGGLNSYPQGLHAEGHIPRAICPEHCVCLLHLKLQVPLMSPTANWHHSW